MRIALQLSFGFLLSFLKTGITVASCRNDEKPPLLIDALIEGWKKSYNVGILFNNLDTSVTVSWQALSNFSKNSLFSTFEKLNKFFEF